MRMTLLAAGIAASLGGIAFAQQDGTATNRVTLPDGTVVEGVQQPDGSSQVVIPEVIIDEDGRTQFPRGAEGRVVRPQTGDVLTGNRPAPTPAPQRGSVIRRPVDDSLIGANLSRTRQAGVDWSGRVLDGANLSRADLSGANLSGASLKGTNFSRATLDGTRLTGAIIRGANFSRADLGGADLSGVVGAESASFSRACGDADTILPPGVDLPRCR